jgi:hypothetical protein
MRFPIFILILVTVLFVIALHDIAAARAEDCNWIYDKAKAAAMAADKVVPTFDVSNTVIHPAEMSRTWSLLYIACKTK